MGGLTQSQMALMPVFQGADVMYSMAVGICLLAGIVYIITVCVYRLTLHPLARYSGPFLAKLSPLYAAYHALIGDIHLDVQRCHEEYGTFVRYGPNSLVVNSLNGFYDIYGTSKRIRKADGYRVFSNTLVGARDKAVHARKKRVIAWGFSETAIKSYEDQMASLIQNFCEKMGEGGSSRNPGGQLGWTPARDMAVWSNYLTTDVVAKVVFGSSWDLMDDGSRDRAVVGVLKGCTRKAGVNAQAPWLRSWRLDWLLMPRLICVNLRAKMCTRKIVRESLRWRAGNEGGRPDEKGEGVEKEEGSIFGRLLGATDPETGNGIGRPELIAESAMLIIAGSDTTATALAATFFYLSRCPTAYRAAQHDVRTAFPRASAIRTGPALSGCQHLRASITEALRCAPPVAQPLWRTVERAGDGDNDGGDTLLIDGEAVPAGTNVACSIYALHHNAALFPRPWAFEIGRWLGAEREREVEVKERQRAWVPFSVGPRQCVAKNFAVMELMLTMARVLWSFDFCMAEGEDGRIGEGGRMAGGDETGLQMGWKGPWRQLVRRAGRALGDSGPALGAVQRGRERKEEFQMVAHFTSAVEGPMIRFKRREIAKAG